MDNQDYVFYVPIVFFKAVSEVFFPQNPQIFTADNADFSD